MRAVLVLLAVVACVAAQEDDTAVQSPGLLDRIMSDYVYPLRDMDWRGAVRGFLEGVMNYLSPDAKEPKFNTPTEAVRLVTHLVTALLDQHLPDEGRKAGEDLQTSLARFLTSNPNVTPSVALYSWQYLGLLVMYCLISVVGALLPILKTAQEEKILDAASQVHAQPMMQREPSMQEVFAMQSGVQHLRNPQHLRTPHPEHNHQPALNVFSNFIRRH